jgi:hypothetical protein
MTDPTTLVDSYLEMWNETDPQHRRELVAATMTDDARYLDPLMSGEGIDGISTMIAGAQQQYPGHRFSLLNGPDAHHDRLRFSWALSNPAGEPIAVGIDFATLDAEGRMGSVTGFLEAPTPA